jgi:hypothetical protein
MTLLAPTLFAASIYMILGRLVRLLDAEQFALIRSRWLTKFFVMGDVLSFLSQGAGKSSLQALFHQVTQQLTSRLNQEGECSHRPSRQLTKTAATTSS